MRRKLGFLTAPQANSQAKDLQTFTPTGDGNALVSFTRIGMINAIYKPLPRQGTETYAHRLIGIYHLIYKPLPRQGTETIFFM